MNLLSRLLFPPKCTVCSELFPYDVADEIALCEDCRKKWDNETLETCGVCAQRVGECLCVTDEMSKARIASFSKLTYYYPQKSASLQNHLIYILKRSRNRRALCFLGTLLGDLVTERLKEEQIDPRDVILTYVPRSYAARLEYGTDQAKELAREISHRTGLVCLRLLRRRWGRNRSQKKLGAAMRYQNAKRTYTLEKQAYEAVRGKTVFLVDDMVTTGISMAVCARMLRKAGAREVRAVAVASDIVNRDPFRH